MGRMHSKGKGMSSSALPYKRSAPSWLKTTPQEVRRIQRSRITDTLRRADGLLRVSELHPRPTPPSPTGGAGVF